MCGLLCCNRSVQQIPEDINGVEYERCMDMIIKLICDHDASNSDSIALHDECLIKNFFLKKEESIKHQSEINENIDGKEDTKQNEICQTSAQMSNNHHSTGYHYFDSCYNVVRCAKCK